MDLTPIEQTKIDCAKKLFNSLLAANEVSSGHGLSGLDRCDEWDRPHPLTSRSFFTSFSRSEAKMKSLSRWLVELNTSFLVPSHSLFPW